MRRAVAEAIVSNQYSDQFYKNQQHGSRQSADQIVPLAIELAKPKSVVDVGCGVGTWLAAFAGHGITDVYGIDGDYVERNRLQISENRFRAHDLSTPIRLDRRFDLVLCLEVAEHLAEEHAATLIDSLVNLGPVVLFSAAIPYQGGTHHVNEQWPEYWARHFAAKGYVPVDCIRMKVWQNDSVEWWYAQNILLYVERAFLQANDALRREATSNPPLSLVHPKRYLDAILMLRLAKEAVEIVPQDESFILVNDDLFDVGTITDRRGVPFLERDGVYWGKPADDDVAIQELERMRRGGSAFMIFSWPSFWWLEYYSGLHRYLRSKFRCVRENDCLIAFDLRREKPAVQ